MDREGAKAMIGEVIADRYRLDGVIAAGGMGAVYTGTHVHMRKRVAVKLLHPETEKLPELVQRFERESIVGGHASHPNVASATDFGKTSDGTYYLVQEYIEGITLRQLLKRGPLELERAVHIAREVALGLDAIHALGIVHRDLAPKNIMVDDEPPYDDVKLIDFGFARVPVEKFDEEEATAIALTSQGVVFGTIGFMAPEAGLGMKAVTEKADLYALGVTFYEMVSGKHPFPKESHKQLFRAHSLDEVPPPSRRSPERPVPQALEAVILRLMEKSPDDRYPTARAFIEALDAAWAVLDGGMDEPVSAVAEPAEETAEEGDDDAPVEVAPRTQRSPKASSSSNGALWAMVMLLLGVAGAAWYFMKGPGRSTAGAPVASTAAPPEKAAPPRTNPVEAPPVTSAATASAAAASASPSAPAAVERPTEVDGRDFVTWKVALRDARSSRNPERTAKALDALAQIDPEKVASPPLLAEVAGAFVVMAVGDDALAAPIFARYSSPPMGEYGPDVLYEVATRHGGSKAAERAVALLKDEKVRALASPALRIAFDLRQAPCPDKPALFTRAGKDGDDRTLLQLQSMSMPGCTGCCRNDLALREALAAIRSR